MGWHMWHTCISAQLSTDWHAALQANSDDVLTLLPYIMPVLLERLQLPEGCKVGGAAAGCAQASCETIWCILHSSPCPSALHPAVQVQVTHMQT